MNTQNTGEKKPAQGGNLGADALEQLLAGVRAGYEAMHAAELERFSEAVSRCQRRELLKQSTPAPLCAELGAAAQDAAERMTRLTTEAQRLLQKQRDTAKTVALQASLLMEAVHIGAPSSEFPAYDCLAPALADSEAAKAPLPQPAFAQEMPKVEAQE